MMANGIKRSRYSRLRYRETRVDEELSVFAGQNRDVASRALENGNISPQRVNADGCGSSRMDHRGHQIKIFREKLAGRARNAGSSCGHSDAPYEPDLMPV
jgi:hypothetical protein